MFDRTIYVIDKQMRGCMAKAPTRRCFCFLEECMFYIMGALFDVQFALWLQRYERQSWFRRLRKETVLLKAQLRMCSCFIAFMERLHKEAGSGVSSHSFGPRLDHRVLRQCTGLPKFLFWRSGFVAQGSTRPHAPFLENKEITSCVRQNPCAFIENDFQFFNLVAKGVFS